MWSLLRPGPKGCWAWDQVHSPKCTLFIQGVQSRYTPLSPLSVWIEIYVPMLCATQSISYLVHKPSNNNRLYFSKCIEQRQQHRERNWILGTWSAETLCQGTRDECCGQCRELLKIQYQHLKVGVLAVCWQGVDCMIYFWGAQPCQS